jgi:LytS/YehU family sensor histidine kinase
VCDGRPVKQLIPRGLAALILLGLLFEGFADMIVISDLLRPTAFNRTSPASTLGAIRDIFGASMVMGAWVAVYFGAHAVWNYRQAEIDRWRLQARAEAARLEALKLQLNPRFFFNSLSSVRSLISEAPRRAKKMVARLARLLRQALQSGDEKTVPLRDELSTTETYLGLEKVRFEDRIDWEVGASEAALSREVPFMLVQTLVENAVRRGIEQRQDGGMISIEAGVPGGPDVEDKSALRLQVTGPGEPDGSSARRSSTGLENARERLGLLFGDDASLELHPNGPETVTATALIPQRASAGQGEASQQTGFSGPAASTFSISTEWRT